MGADKTCAVDYSPTVRMASRAPPTDTRLLQGREARPDCAVVRDFNQLLADAANKSVGGHRRIRLGPRDSTNTEPVARARCPDGRVRRCRHRPTIRRNRIRRVTSTRHYHAVHQCLSLQSVRSHYCCHPSCPFGIEEKLLAKRAYSNPIRESLVGTGGVSV